MLGHTGPTCSLEGLLVSTDVKLDVGTVGLVVSRDIKLGLGIAFQVQSVNYQSPHRNSSTTKAPGFAGQRRAMACGATLALGKAEEDLQGWAVSVVVGQPCFEPWHGADKRTEAQICFYSSVDPRVPNERKKVCAPGGNFLRQIYLLVGQNWLRGSAVTATARASRRRGAGAGDAQQGFGAGGAGNGAARQPEGECRPRCPVVSSSPAGTAWHPRTPPAAEGAAAAPGVAGTGKVFAPRRAAGSTAQHRPGPTCAARLTPGSGGGAEALTSPLLAAAPGGRAAIGVHRSQCRPAPPRRGFITGIPMAETGNLLWREGGEPARGTVRAARWRTRRCRAERRPPGRAVSGGRRVPPSHRCPAAAPPRDHGAAGLAQRRGLPVPAGAAARASASGSRPSSHGAPGKWAAVPAVGLPCCRLPRQVVLSPARRPLPCQRRRWSPGARRRGAPAAPAPPWARSGSRPGFPRARTLARASPLIKGRVPAECAKYVHTCWYLLQEKKKGGGGG